MADQQLNIKLNVIDNATKAFVEVKNSIFNLRNALIVKISDPKLKEELDSLIQTFIDELNSYEEITKYRVYKNGKKFFIWEIDPSELSSWTDITMKKSKKGYKSPRSRTKRRSRK